ncbi:MAG: hypothetical protein KA184_16520 [Candidatus Hydrogenedentes bacterium]|nr:hypothetical protein [Candidatus Hydrogenedentota bacterium]
MRIFTFGLTVGCAMVSLTVAADAQESYALTVLPAEHRLEKDAATGAELVYLTTNPARDVNLYFHERSWLSDESMIIFLSSREGEGGHMGYLTATGELVRLDTERGALGAVTAARDFPGVFAVRGRDVLELRLRISVSQDTAARPSAVQAVERVIGALPEGELHSSLNENADGTFLSVGMKEAEPGSVEGVYVIETATGAVRKVCDIVDSTGHAWHVQCSRTDPNLVSYAGKEQRLWVVDVREGIPRNVYKAWPGELVTHESWWVNDDILFLGGIHPYPYEDSHVKLLDLDTGVVRVVGAGAWWEGAEPEELSRVNWWHAAGSDDGRWIAADNWHGDIVLFEAATTRPRLLTRDHRTYGEGDHPHVGWDRSGRAVVFASHRLGNLNVCVARIPESWQPPNDTPSPRTSGTP